jgi:hypothetical protein
MACLKRIAMISAFVSHVFTQYTCICREAAHSHTDIIVDLEHLFLVTGQIRW